MENLREQDIKFPGANLRSVNGNKWPSILLPAGEFCLVVKVPMEDGTSRTYSIELRDPTILAKFTAALITRLNDMVEGINKHISQIKVSSCFRVED